LLDQHLPPGGRLGVAALDEGSSIGGREVDVEHLDSGQLVEDGARRDLAAERFGGEPGPLLLPTPARLLREKAGR